MTGLASRPYYFSRVGDPISLEEWAQLHGNDSYRTVARHLLGGWTVSTVWLGLDHAWHGPPQIFETMIFSPDGRRDTDRLNGYQKRYSTETAAEDGHYDALRDVMREILTTVDAVISPDMPPRPRRLEDSLFTEEPWERRDAMRWRP